MDVWYREACYWLVVECRRVRVSNDQGGCGHILTPPSRPRLLLSSSAFWPGLPQEGPQQFRALAAERVEGAGLVTGRKRTGKTVGSGRERTRAENALCFPPSQPAQPQPARRRTAGSIRGNASEEDFSVARKWRWLRCASDSLPGLVTTIGPT